MNKNEQPVKIEKVSDPLEQLKAFEGIDLSLSFKIDEEKDEAGEPIAGKAYWVGLQDGEHKVEGKLYQPEIDKQKKELVIFEPGLPGNGVVIFDQRHAAKMIKQGYDVFSARHNGTVLNAEKSARYVNCPQKQELGQQQGQEYLGQPFSYTEWGREVLTAIKALENKYNKIHLISHSMGALNTLNSLAHLKEEAPELIPRIESFTSLAGSLGQLKSNGDFDPEGMMNLDRMRGFLEYIKKHDIHRGIEVEQEIGRLKENFQRNYETDYSDYKNTRFFLLALSKKLGGESDEYNPYSASKEFAQHIKDQLPNLRLAEYSTKALKGSEAHDLMYLRTGILLRWLDKETAEELYQ